MAKEAIIGSLDALYATLSEAEVATERLVAFFDGQVGAFAYLLFILTYMPCLAAMGAIFKEFGWKWVIFTALWTTGQAYVLSTLFYQSATIKRHPDSSLYWIVLLCLIEILVYTGLHLAGKRRRRHAV